LCGACAVSRQAINLLRISKIEKGVCGITVRALIAALTQVGSETAFILNSARLLARDGKKPANPASAPLATMEIRHASTPS